MYVRESNEYVRVFKVCQRVRLRMRVGTRIKHNIVVHIKSNKVKINRRWKIKMHISKLHMSPLHKIMNCFVLL